MRDATRFGKYALIRYRGGALGESPLEDYSSGDLQKIRLGYNEIPLGIDETLFTMKIGESGTVIVPPEKAYGDHDSEGIQICLRSKVPDGADLKVGSILGWKNPLSQQVLPVRVVEATDDYVKLDYNHPLAGKSLEYWLELVEIVDE